MAKYTPEDKLEIVKSVLEDGINVSEVARKYQASRSEIRKLVAAYQAHGMAGITKKHKKYSGEFKQEVVQYMHANNLSLCEIAAKYNLGSHSVIANWERIYQEEGPEGLYVERRGGAHSNSGVPQILDKKLEEDLIAENKRLRMENDYLKKLNALVQEREKSEMKKKLR